MKIKLFFTYYGGKWRVGQHYPKPSHNTIIEPFAGSAGYSHCYPHLQVKLVDLDPTICGVWDYLIHTSASEIRSLPLEFSHVDNLHVPKEARHLIGFWLNKGSASPCKTPSKWMRSGTCATSFWGEAIRERIASQVDLIRHWTIKQGSYTSLENSEATWFVDPPYQKMGKIYRFSDVSFSNLATFCESRLGQVIVCEQAGATWLPFQSWRTIQTTPGSRGRHTSEEVIWYKP